jgi:hypothetical protein
MLPQELQSALTELRRKRDASPPDIRSIFLEDTPIDRILSAFGPSEAGSKGHRRLTWLAFHAARRALACWDLYCDGTEPHVALQALHEWLTTGRRSGPWFLYKRPALPEFQGHLITDCTQCDTSCAAYAVASAVRFALTANTKDWYSALYGFEGAFDESPLNREEEFDRWFFDVAVPAAYEERDLTPEEREAFRSYDVAELAAARERWHAPAP